MAFRLIRDLYDSSKFVPFFLPALLFLRTLKSLLYSDTRAQIRDPAARLRRILHKGSALHPIGCIRCERDGGFRDYTYSFAKKKKADRQIRIREIRVIKSGEFENQSPSAFRFAAVVVCVFVTRPFGKTLSFSLFIVPFLLSARIFYIRPTLQVVSRRARTEDVSQRIFPRFPLSLSSAFPSPCTRRGSAPTMGLHGPGEVEEEEGNEDQTNVKEGDEKKNEIERKDGRFF